MNTSQRMATKLCHNYNSPMGRAVSGSVLCAMLFLFIFMVMVVFSSCNKAISVWDQHFWY